MNSASLARAVFCSLLLALPSGPAMSESFSQGSKRLAVIVGAGSAFADDYLVIGAGFGYYLIDGLELGINWQSWRSGEPTFEQVQPEITYTYDTRTSISPYAGLLYRRLFIDGREDLSGVGGRAGLNIDVGARAYLGAGFVYVNYTNCNESRFRDCDETYPEFTLSFTF